MPVQTKSRQVPLNEFVAALKEFPATAFEGTDEILGFLQRTLVDPESLSSYLTWDRQHYTRNLIDKTAHYELIAICWEVGQASSVHNHRDQNCWMAVPMGRLLVENFHLVRQDIAQGSCRLEPLNTVEMNLAEPCAVNPADPVHRVIKAREFNHRAVSLHVYSRPFDTCVVYSPEQGTCGEIKLHFNTEYGNRK